MKNTSKKNNAFTEMQENQISSQFDSEKKYTNLPLLVIAGRPNVGKSTLFNRLLHKRRTITSPEPGVTRDPIEEDAFVKGFPLRIMDTGGFKLERKQGTKEALLDELVVNKTLESLKKADCILLLLEAGNITGEDEEFISLVRPYWNNIIAVVNKTEGGKDEHAAWDFYKFGFKEIICISAEHGDHIQELTDLIISRIDFSSVREDSSFVSPIRIAVVGKPNTGKSTLSNRLTHTQASIVSDYAGTTRDSVEGSFSYNGYAFEIIDTAGIRRKAKVSENIEYYSVNRAIKSLDKADIVFLMIDAQEGLTEQDKKIAALANNRGRGIIFAINKWDTQNQDRKTIKQTEEHIKIMFGQMSYVPIVCISALEGSGIKMLLNTAVEIYGQLTRKIETGPLNTALQEWLKTYPPPMARTAHFKIRYMVQTQTNPVSFLLFATKPEIIQPSYISYLKNKIRTDLGYDKIPVLIDIKASRKKWEERNKFQY
ncbi:MAG: ribosome biogenesis GTPase Der [Bacteroides sp.]|nr:ribosome biogenesis GTPase Der [Prevotella sp.]MCM1408805.1 ribosome biogenesis GTPase Der [Treponema brennaborense]MCM1470585.1 ribosome biogenesis GTPase Der [Bacteroides sp.]